jgi:hypothetical protein
MENAQGISPHGYNKCPFSSGNVDTSSHMYTAIYWIASKWRRDDAEQIASLALSRESTARNRQPGGGVPESSNRWFGAMTESVRH